MRRPLAAIAAVLALAGAMMLAGCDATVMQTPYWRWSIPPALPVTTVNAHASSDWSCDLRSYIELGSICYIPASREAANHVILMTRLFECPSFEGFIGLIALPVHAMVP